MISALAYRPRSGPLQEAPVGAAAAFCLVPCAIAFAFAGPIVLAGCAAAVVVAAARAGALEAIGAAMRFAIPLALLVALVNPIVTSRGDTVLARGPVLPLLGPLDITLEALAAGGIIGMRVLVAVSAFALYSACVDPDRVLRAIRPVARRSAMTAALVSRLVPVAAADAARLRETAGLRGPGAAPAGTAVVARRLVAGSLERSVDVAATLELRGFGLPSPRTGVRPSRPPLGRFAAAAAAPVAAAVAGLIAGVGGLQAYPVLSVDAGPGTLALALGLPAIAWLAFAGTSSTNEATDE